LGNTYTAIAPTRVSLVLTNDAALTWEWRTNFWLAARAGPRGTIAGGNQWYGRAEMGVVEARPAEYCRFVRWTGTVTSAANPLRIPMLRPHRLVADFAAERTPQGTPHWWLAAFGLTNLDWETEAMRDADGDGLLNWQEHAASSDPRDGQSRFAIAEAGCAQGTNYLRWPSAGVDEELPPFRVEVSTNLLRIGGWSPGVPPTVARPRGGGTNVWLENSALPAPNRFYRIMATNAP
jgi:hypothetical protein